MLSEETLFVDYLFYASWLPGLVLVVVGALNSQMRLLIFIGIAMPGGALVFASSQTVAIKFEVMVFKQVGDTLETELTRQFVGGDYTFGDGRIEAVTKPGVKQVETVLINDSPKTLDISSALYGVNPQGRLGGDRENVGTIGPGEFSHVPSRHIVAGPESEGPPTSILDQGWHDVVVYWVNWK